jgi:hypothetical protein
VSCGGCARSFATDKTPVEIIRTLVEAEGREVGDAETADALREWLFEADYRAFCTTVSDNETVDSGPFPLVSKTYKDLVVSGCQGAWTIALVVFKYPRRVRNIMDDELGGQSTSFLKHPHREC